MRVSGGWSPAPSRRWSLLAEIARRDLKAGRRFEGALALSTLAASCIGLWALTRVRDDILDHEIFWLAAFGAINLAVIGGAGVRALWTHAARPMEPGPARGGRRMCARAPAGSLRRRSRPPGLHLFRTEAPGTVDHRRDLRIDPRLRARRGHPEAARHDRRSAVEPCRGRGAQASAGRDARGRCRTSGCRCLPEPTPRPAPKMRPSASGGRDGMRRGAPGPGTSPCSNGAASTSTPSG